MNEYLLNMKLSDSYKRSTLKWLGCTGRMNGIQIKEEICDKTVDGLWRGRKGKTNKVIDERTWWNPPKEKWEKHNEQEAMCEWLYGDDEKKMICKARKVWIDIVNCRLFSFPSFSYLMPLVDWLSFSYSLSAFCIMLLVPKGNSVIGMYDCKDYSQCEPDRIK